MNSAARWHGELLYAAKEIKKMKLNIEISETYPDFD